MAPITVWPHGDPRDVARAIVADPHYRVAPTPPPAQATWLDAVRAWLAGLLRDLLHIVDRALSAKNPFDAAIGVAVIVVAFGLLAYCVVILVRAYARRTPAGRLDPAAASAAGLPPQSALELRTAAQAAARAARYRDAAALLFASAARGLEERGRVAYDPARTPGEYRRLVRDAAFDDLAGDAVVALFDAPEPPGELFEHMSSAYDRFFAAMRTP